MTHAVLDHPVSQGQVWLELSRVQVKDLRRNSADSGAAESLRHSLEAGLAADPDPRRANFYEASLDGFRYYFHVLPGRPTKVFLLARWRERE